MLRKLVIIVTLLLSTALFAEEFVAGKDYELVKSKSSQDVGIKGISVTEFFSYGCPWCYRIDASLNKWLTQQGTQVRFSRVPVVFNKDWMFYAKAYYTVNALGVDNKLNPILFNTIQSKSSALNSNDAMINFLIKQGLDKEVVTSAFKNSTTIDMQVNEGAASMAYFHVTAVPAFVINNQFKTDLQMAKTEERLFKIMDYLVSVQKK